jgi:hypothetical protein
MQKAQCEQRPQKQNEMVEKRKEREKRKSLPNEQVQLWRGGGHEITGNSQHVRGQSSDGVNVAHIGIWQQAGQHKFCFHMQEPPHWVIYPEGEVDQFVLRGGLNCLRRSLDSSSWGSLSSAHCWVNTHGYVCLRDSGAELGPSVKLFTYLLKIAY